VLVVDNNKYVLYYASCTKYTMKVSGNIGMWDFELSATYEFYWTYNEGKLSFLTNLVA